MGRRSLIRSRWLTRRLWLVAVSDAALVAHSHWRRLAPKERRRLARLVRKSRGRPSKNLSWFEKHEADRLLHKLGHIELFGSIAAIVLPFRSARRLVTLLFASRRTLRRKR